jgi:predicted lipid-binding transport protein (Tim44 family)
MCFYNRPSHAWWVIEAGSDLGLPLVTLIVLAVLAAVVLYQLYAVLGRKVGRQPEDNAAGAPVSEARVKPLNPEEPAVVLTGLAALRAREPGFDLAQFLTGARAAYEMIVVAFAERDRDTLRGLLSPKVFKGFEAVMAEREARGETETVEFLQPPRGDLEDMTVDGDIARARVRFLAEHRSRTKTDEGEAVDDRRTAEVWTFERDLTSGDPNWILVRVDAAEA